MNLLDLIDHTRKARLDDAVSQRYRWSDEQLVRWLNEAENAFVRATRCITDSVSALTQLAVQEGVSEYDLDERILQVHTVSNADGRVLMKRPAYTPFVQVIGAPFQWQQQGHTLIFDRAPEADATYQMVIDRLPLTPMVNDGDTPEIPSYYHLPLCDWAAYRAVSSPDIRTEKGYAQIAAEFRMEWGKAVNKARREYFQRKRGQGPW